MIGRRLAHYEILDQIGTGGMGDVYRARDLKLGRDIALKFLPPAVAEDPIRRQRLDREARSLAMLNHPNIVTIYSIEEAEGSYFLAMELVQGEELARLIPPRGFPTRRLFELAVPLADAVASAHTTGVTHRDLKPANVMVDRHDRLKVLDFGLARVCSLPTGDSTLPATQITETGRVLGTVPYMSPEQVRGEGVDPRSDVFSMGVIFYEMATGARPFQGSSAADVIAAILKDDPPALPDSAFGFAGSLARIVHRCLEKDPDHRYPSAVEVKDELQDVWLGAKPLPELPARRSRAERPPKECKRIVVLPFENLGSPSDAYVAAGITEEIRSRLCAVRNLGVISRTSATHYDRTGKTVQDIGADLHADYVLEGTVQWDRSSPPASRIRVTPELVRVSTDTHLWSDRYDRSARELLTVQTEIAREVVRQLDVALGETDREHIDARPTENLDAYEAYLRAKTLVESVDDLSMLGSAAALLERAVALDPGFTTAWSALSRVNSLLAFNRQDPDGQCLSRAREALDRALVLDPGLPATRLALGYYYYHGQRDRERALEVFVRMAAGRGREEIHDALSHLEARLGRWEEAIAHLDSAIDLDPRNGRLWAYAGALHSDLRRYAEADLRYQKAISLSPDRALFYLWRAMNLMKWKGDPDLALDELAKAPVQKTAWLAGARYQLHLYRRDLESALKELDSVMPDAIEDQAWYRPKGLVAAIAHALLGDGGRSREYAESTRSGLEEECRRRPDDPRIRMALAVCYALLGRGREALQEGNAAVELCPVSRDALLGPVFLQQLTEVRVLAGKHDEAIQDLKQLLSIPRGLCVNVVRVDPLWLRLSDDSRFQKLLQRQPAD